MGKKIFTIVLATVFMFTIRQNVFAANITTNGGTAKVPVKYTANNTAFIITVPTVIQAKDVETQFEITSSEMNLRPDQQIQVYISEGCDTNGKIILNRQGATTATAATLETTATVAGRSVASNNFRVGLFKDSSTSTTNLDGKVTLSKLNVTKNTRAGDYLATICFKVELTTNG